MKNKKFNQRGLCTANVRQAIILPKGEITICEQLMFNPKFILGNLLDNDLGTIWKNNKLKHLENIDLYQNTRCGKCNDFSKCRNSKSNGVCWKEVIHAYGEDKWNNPDPKCPHAPTKMNSFFIE